MPESLSDDQAMLVEPLACSLRAVLKLDSGPKPHVLVVAGDSRAWRRCIGSPASCRRRKSPAWPGTISRPSATALGAHQVLRSSDPQTLADAAQTRCIRFGGNVLLQEGFDAVIDSLGSPATVHRSLRWVRPGGQLVVLGDLCRAGWTTARSGSARSAPAASTPHGMETFRGRNVATMTLTMELLAGEAPLGVNLVTHRMPLADFARAMRIASDKRKSQAVRVAVIP